MWFYVEFTVDGEETFRTPAFINGAPTVTSAEHVKFAWVALTDENWEEVTLVGTQTHTGKKVTKRFVRTLEGIYPHKCVEDDCDSMVQFDDEPRCFTHSPDEGSSVNGYSARAEALK